MRTCHELFKQIDQSLKEEDEAPCCSLAQDPVETSSVRLSSPCEPDESIAQSDHLLLCSMNIVWTQRLHDNIGFLSLAFYMRSIYSMELGMLIS